MSSAFKVALVRAILTAIASGGTVFFAMATTVTLGAALYAASAAAFTTLIARAGVEGWIDTQAAKPPTP